MSGTGASRVRPGLGFALALVLLVAHAGTGAATDGPVTITAPGMWTLTRLGYGQQHVPADAGQNVVRIPFRLGKAAADRSHACYSGGSRSKTCFLIHFHFRVRFAPGAAPGYVKVSAATNRRTASQVIFALKRPADRLTIDWSTLDLIRGYEPHTTTETSLEVNDTNYLQTQGLRAGDNTLDFQLDTPAAAVESLDILPDSGLEWIAQPPGRLTLLVPDTQKAVVGRVFRVKYVVRLLFGRPLENVSVVARAGSTGVETVGTSRRRIATLTGAVAGSFAFRPTSPGRASVAIHVSSGTSSPTKIVHVAVAPD
jgi:hypothetical protein